MKRAIIHMDLDSFFVSCERLVNPELNGLPVIIAGNSDRSVVSSCSYEARKFGVHSAMSAVKARQLCPSGIFVGGTIGLYAKQSKIVTDIIDKTVPLYEKASIDEFYIDLSGMDKFFNAYEFAISLRQKIIMESGLPISFALASNKTVAKIGCGEAKPNGHLHIAHGKEKEFLAPLSIKKVPGIGKKTFTILNAKGFSLIQDIQLKTEGEMEAILGNSGLSIWRKCQGICNRQVSDKPNVRKSISKETTFSKDVNDDDFIISTIIGLCEKAAFTLRKKGMLASNVAIKIKYHNFENTTKQVKIDFTSDDQKLIETAISLYKSHKIPYKKVRLVGIRYGDLNTGAYQTNLFNNNEKTDKLYKAMDNLKIKFGKNAVKRAKGL